MRMLIALVCTAAFGAEFIQDPAYAPNRVIITFNPNQSKTAVQAMSDNTVIRRTLSADGSVMLCETGTLSVDAFIRANRGNPGIAGIEPDHVLRAYAVPNDMNFFHQWGMHNTVESNDIDAPEAWDILGGAGTPVIVAVIDTGIDYTHTDLKNMMWINPAEDINADGQFTLADVNGIDEDVNGFIDDVVGWDFYGRKNTPMDDAGHGTHVAGIIAAQMNNTVGIAGVCPRTKLMALKFLNASGYGYTSDAIEAIYYAIHKNVRICNSSWGGSTYSAALRNAISDAMAADMLFVAAAGNEGISIDTYPRYPAAYGLSNILSVAAVDRNFIPAGFSCYGISNVHVAAPGVSIYSTLPTNYYGSYNGTSMAAPFAAGVAALLLSLQNALTAADMKRIIMNTVRTNSALAEKTASGGVVNANRSLIALASGYPVLSSAGAVHDGFAGTVTISYVLSHGGALPCDLSAKYKKRTSSNWTVIAPTALTPSPAGVLPGTNTLVWNAGTISRNTVYQILLTAVDPNGFTSSVIIEFTSSVDGISLSSVRTINNPYRGTGSGIIFTNVPAGAKISIVTVSGHPVYYILPQAVSGGTALWDITSLNGRAVVPGVYIARIEYNSDTAWHRVIVSRRRP